MKIKSTIQRLAATVAAVAALCAAPTASADPGVLIATGYSNGSASFTTNLGSFNAGGFNGTWNAQGIQFWCIELTQTFSFNTPYTDYLSAPETTSVLNALGQLFTLAYGSALTDANHSAAFQLAVWELVYDSDHSLQSPGAFYVTGGNSTARTIAQGWLSSLGPNSPDTVNLTFLTSDRHQNFVTFVPEPAPIALLALAMLAMMVVRRRREHRIGM